jgi:hypothetical protein
LEATDEASAALALMAKQGLPWQPVTDARQSRRF